MVMPAFDSLKVMGSKSLTAEQNLLARELVRELLNARYGGKKVAAAKDLGVSQPLLSGFLAGDKGLGVKLLNGISRRAPEVAAKILGNANIASAAVETTPAPIDDAPVPPVVAHETIEGAIEELTDKGYPYRNVKAALAGVSAYESARERRARAASVADIASLATGLLDKDAAIVGASAARSAHLREGHARALRDSQELAKRGDRVGKRRAAK